MKDLPLLVWLTQFSISVVSPPICCILLAVWLRSQFGWGAWIIWVGAIVGGLFSLSGLRSSLKMMARMAKNKQEPKPPPVSFNDHD